MVEMPEKTKKQPALEETRGERISLTAPQDTWELIDQTRSALRLTRDDFVGAVLKHALTPGTLPRHPNPLPPAKPLGGPNRNNSFMSQPEIWADFRWAATAHRMRGAAFFAYLISLYCSAPPAGFDAERIAWTLPPVDEQKKKQNNWRPTRLTEPQRRALDAGAERPVYTPQEAEQAIARGIAVEADQIMPARVIQPLVARKWMKPDRGGHSTSSTGLSIRRDSRSGLTGRTGKSRAPGRS